MHDIEPNNAYYWLHYKVDPIESNGDNYPGQTIAPIEVDIMFQIVSINQCKFKSFFVEPLTVDFQDLDESKGSVNRVF